MKKNSRYVKSGAVVLTVVLLAAAFLVPAFNAANIGKVENSKRVVTTQQSVSAQLVTKKETGFEPNTRYPSGYPPTEDNGQPVWLDTVFNPEEDLSPQPAYMSDHGDIGYNVDVGNNIYGAVPIHVGEPVDQTIPGRGRTASLDPGTDSEDWYWFTLAEGQSVQASISTSGNYDWEFTDTEANPVGQSLTADVTGRYFMHVFANSGASAGDYSISISVQNQNDAGSGGDAGNGLNQATSISPGSYSGYMNHVDTEDWYSFSVSSGQGIFVTVEPVSLKEGDFDAYIYNPSGTLVHSGHYYGIDEIEYPADTSGTWKIKFDMFPGWDESKWPDNYFLYGHGAYEFTLEVGGSAEAPPGPIPQPDVTPIAQTFKVNNDPNSNKDEFSYLAAIPAANYIDDGQRYVSPIVYQGDDSKTWWYGTTDDTTQYLLDDWNTYLDRHGMTAEEHTLSNDPIQAAADLATTHWSSSDTVVVAVDGADGGFQDDVETVVQQSASLSTQPQVTRVAAGSSKFVDVDGRAAVPMFVGSSVGAIRLKATGDEFSGDTGILTPRYETVQEDWWPYPYDFNGPDGDSFYPIVMSGFWAPYVTADRGLGELQIEEYEGQHYKIPINDIHSSINVTVTTDQPSSLMVYLVDPNGVLRRPNLPHWVGEPGPIHDWNGGHWQHDYEQYRRWYVEPNTEFSVEIHNPIEGDWKAIVVPHFTGDNSGSLNFNVEAKVRSHDSGRCNSELSAANAAVLASLNHAPLLYVTADSVPSATQNAIDTLGANNIIFVNIGSVSSASLSGATEYTTMQEVVDAIKESQHSENFITVTSLASQKGFFAPAAMIAAYHGSPVFDIGEEAPEAYNDLDKGRVTTYYMGDYYHGCLSTGHLHKLSYEFNFMEFITNLLQGQLPPIGFDQHKRWFNGAQEGIYSGITAKYNLDLPGKEAYMFVADRENDIRDPVCMVMSGNESFAGHIPLKNPALDSALICRDILYPAIIYANPGRDVCTSQLMNFADGRQWTTNDGVSHSVYTSRMFKESFMSHGRFYEGHSIWEGLLERYNKGAAISYYSGHGTGGSGISAQYKNVNDQFPYIELRHEELKDFTWWDSWRGYMYDDKQTKTPRWGGFTWYNAVEPNVYDIIHFKYVDQLFDNLHSEMDMWMSCTTGSHMGPNIYLEHGAALWYGNGGTGLCPQEELLDGNMLHDMLIHGESVGKAMSDEIWLHQRDYTTDDPTAMYASSSMTVTNIQMIFGDPTMVCYSPEWTEPTPISG